MNYYPKDREFERFAKSEHNISSNKLDIYNKQASLTPYILEEREMIECKGLGPMLTSYVNGRIHT